MLRASTVTPTADADAAILAVSRVRARIGRGNSTSTSRRSGNMESQLITANKPTASMLVEMRKCPATQLKIMPAGVFVRAPDMAPAISASHRLTKTSSAANCPSSLLTSPCGARISKSTMRNRKSR